MYYQYPKFEQSRHELEREQKLRNQIYLARREARERRRASRISLLTRVRGVFGARREPCPPPCPELL